jgi:SpoIIAA-like
MVTVIPASGPGTLAFVISGRLTSGDYQEVLLPPVRETIARGEQIRMLAVIEDFQGLEPGALLGDLKAAARLGLGQRSLASYFAVVSDAEWVRRGISLFGWLVPGEIRVFATAQRTDAETWLATAGERSD